MKKSILFVGKNDKQILADDCETLKQALSEMMGIKAEVKDLEYGTGIKVDNYHSVFAIHKRLKGLFDMRIYFKRPNDYIIELL